MNWGTNMDNDKLDDAALEALFVAGKAASPAPSPDFMARLSADAAAATPRPQPLATPAPRPSPFTRFKGLFAASGLSGAAALGVWIGFVMPDLVTTVSPVTEDVAGLTMFLPGADLSLLSE
jgi:hypothetical protein